MKTSFSIKVTGSITVSIEPSNEDTAPAVAAGVDDGDDDNVLFEALLAPYMKSLMNDAVKKYVRAVKEEDEDDDEELSSPLPKRRVPVNADDSVEEEEEEDSSVEEEEEEASVEEEDEEDEAGDLPNVQIEYQYADDNSLSQKMNTLNLRRRH